MDENLKNYLNNQTEKIIKNNKHLVEIVDDDDDDCVNEMMRKHTFKPNQMFKSKDLKKHMILNFNNANDTNKNPILRKYAYKERLRKKLEERNNN
jgi:hypothetical protein